MRRSLAATFLASLILLTIPAAAHEEFRVVGTVTKAARTGVEIRIADGRIIPVRFDVVTRVWRGEERVADTELRTGGRVDIRAIGDSLEEDLLALEVHIVGASAPAP